MLDKIFEDLVNIPGAAGQEHYVRKYLKEQYTKYTDEIVQDKLGSIFAIKKSKKENAPVIMLAGHMDEVGGMVTGITDEGLVKIVNLGGLDYATFVGVQMEVIINENDRIRGITLSKPPHLNGNAKDLKFKDIMLDIGADSKEHAKELGVKLGQQVIPVNNFTYTKDGKKVISKAWDDRWGCGMALTIFKELHDKELDVTLVCGATVQEEVGLRGAHTSTYMINPDVFLTLDTSPASDIYGEKEYWGKLGDGFLVRFFDPSYIMPGNLKRYIEDLAEKNNIKNQQYISMGGTDAAVAQMTKDGIIAGAINLPARYIHSSASMIHVDDSKSAQDFLTKFVTGFNQDELSKIKVN